MDFITMLLAFLGRVSSDDGDLMAPRVVGGDPADLQGPSPS
jgi:hypothetical protein